MRIQQVSIFLLSLIFSTQIFAKSRHPDYEKLKLWRTYSQVMDYYPQKESFTLCYLDHGQKIKRILAASTVAEAKKFSIMPGGTNFTQATTGKETDCDKPIVSVPEEYKEIAATLIKETRARYKLGDKTSVEVFYEGKLSHLTVLELRPVKTPKTEDDKYLISYGQSSFTISEQGAVSFNGVRFLIAKRALCDVRNDFTRQQLDCSQKPLFLNYLMAAEIEGTLDGFAGFIHNGFNNHGQIYYGPLPQYKEQEKKWKESVLEYAKDLENNITPDNLDKVLGNQEDGILPSESFQQFAFSFKASSELGKKLYITSQFNISFLDLLRGDVFQTQNLQFENIKIRLISNNAGDKLIFEVIRKNETLYSTSYKLEFKGDIIKDKKNQVFIGSLLRTEDKDKSSKLKRIKGLGPDGMGEIQIIIEPEAELKENLYYFK